MTLREFNQKKEKIATEVQEEYAVEAKLWKEKKGRSSPFTSYGAVYSESFDNQFTADDIISMLQEFKEEVSRLPYHILGAEEITLEADSDEIGYGHVTTNRVVYNFLGLMTIEQVMKIFPQKRIRAFVKEELIPDSKKYRYGRDVDCKLLKLFEDGNIDFKTLQKLVYSDCDV